MTSALQLVYIWRYPARRSLEPIAALETDHPDPEPDVRRSSRDGRHGRRGVEGDPSRRPHARATMGRHSKSCGSHKEREQGRSSSNVNGVVVSNSTLIKLGLTRNDQLPVAVHEARKRLLERLRSVSLTEIRQRTPEDEVVNAKKKKIPAFMWDALCTVKGEKFRSCEEKYEGGVNGALPECCICLEGFKDGDLLIKLSCRHKFHPTCLEPWVRSSGDCPLCRADIM